MIELGMQWVEPEERHWKIAVCTSHLQSQVLRKIVVFQFHPAYLYACVYSKLSLFIY